MHLSVVDDLCRGCDSQQPVAMAANPGCIETRTSPYQLDLRLRRSPVGFAAGAKAASVDARTPRGFSPIRGWNRELSLVADDDPVSLDADDGRPGDLVVARVCAQPE